MSKPTTFSQEHQQRIRDFGDGQTPTIGPESVGIVPTNACNLNCITCWSYSPLLDIRPNASWKRKQLDFALMSPLLHELAALKTRRIILTGGGDPLVYPHFDESVLLAKQLGLKVTLISNLTLIKDLATFLSLKIDTIQANFSAADAAGYVAFHPNRKPKDFEAFMEKLKAIAAQTPDLKLVCVICQTNADALPNMLRLAAELGTKIQFKLMSVSKGTENVAITPTQHQWLLQNEQEILRQAIDLRVPTNLPVFFKELRGETIFSFPIEEVGCYTGQWYSRVWADGSVHFCCNPAPELKIGSLHNNSFTDIWQGEFYKQTRQQIHGGKLVNGCHQCGKFDLNCRLQRELRPESA